MSSKIRNLFAAAAVCAAGILCMPQQLPAASQNPDYSMEQLPAQDRSLSRKEMLEQKAEIQQPELKAKSKENVILAAPESLTADKISYASVTLSWSETAGAAGYQVEYSADGTHYTTAGRTAAGTRTYKCGGLLTGTEYRIRVCAVDQTGRLGNYAAIKAVPVLAKSKITKSAVVQMKKIELEWKKISGAESYYLYRKAEGEKSFKVIAVTGQTSYSDTAAAAGSSYEYRVCAVRKAGGTSVKGKLSAKVQVKVIMPDTQLESCASVDYKSIRLTWKPADSVTGYYIYRSVKEDGTYRKIKTVNGAAAVTYTDTGVVPGKKFYYKINTFWKAADQTITLGQQSPAMQAQTVLAAPKLAGVRASSNNKGIVLSWDKMAGISGYRIYRSLSAKKGFVKIKDILDGNASSFEDRSTVPGGIYYYRIKAIYANRTYKGLSLASSILEAGVVPAAPIGLTVSQTATDSLKISWMETNGAQNYNLYRGDSASAVYTCIAEGIAGNTYTDTNLDNDKTYFYRVSAAGAAGEGTKCRPVYFTVGAISLNTRTLRLCVGASKSLEAVTFRQGRVVWKSENPKIAEVDTQGKVTGIACGTVKITVTAAGKSASAVISVTPGKKNGIDVSRWQEDIDWCRVKKSGVEFAFLRISNHYDEDYTFETKYANATAAGIPLGVYCYSRAASVEEAEQEARTVLEILNGRKLDYPIAMDLEDAVHKSEKMTKDTLHQMILAFKKTVEDAGYRFVLYSYVTFINTYLDKTKLDGIDLWLARYRSVSLGTGYTGTGNVKYWQYNSGQYSGSNSQVDGITDTSGSLVSVDVNIEY